jgi:hypothetical protein
VNYYKVLNEQTRGTQITGYRKKKTGVNSSGFRGVSSALYCKFAGQRANTNFQTVPSDGTSSLFLRLSKQDGSLLSVVVIHRPIRKLVDLTFWADRDCFSSAIFTAAIQI